MEIVGAVAGVFSVIGFAGQLNQGIGKLYTFWSNIKDAPASIQSIAANLDTLTELLTELASEGQNIAPNDLLAKVLLQAEEKTQELTAIVRDLEPDFDSKRVIVRKWNALKSVLKSAKLTNYQQILASLERQLMLALELQQSRLGRIRFERLEQRLVAIDANTKARELTYTTGTALICPDPAPDLGILLKSPCASSSSTHHSSVVDDGDSPMLSRSHILSQTILWTKRLCLDNTSSLSNSLGSIHIRTQKISWQLVSTGSDAMSAEQEQHENRIACIYIPAPWLQNLGFKRALHVSLAQPSIGPWKPKMNIYNTVSEEAPIFKLCARGDVHGVRDLMVKGKASIHDMDPSGRTLIYFAVDAVQPQMYRFLVNAGAQETVLVPKLRPHFRLDHPLQEVMFNWRYYHASLEETMDAIRTFQQHMDFEVESSGWKLLMVWAYTYDPQFNHRGTAELDLLRWFLQLFKSEIAANLNSRPCKMLLLQLLERPAAFDCFFGQVTTHNVDEVGPLQEYTILQQAIAAGCGYSPLLKYRPNLHVVRYDYSMSRKPETPTSLALYNAAEFKGWRTALEQMNVDIESFIDEELRQTPLAADGWTKDSLRQLFSYHIDLSLIGHRRDYDDFCPIQYCASFCSSSHWWFAGTKVQPLWMLMLELFKFGVSAEQIQQLGLPRTSRDAGEGDIGIDTDQLMVLGHPHAFMPLRDSKLALWMNNDLVNCEKGTNHSAFRYGRTNVFCMDCWLFYEKTGRSLGMERRRLEKEDVMPDPEFSPFFIHSSNGGPGGSSKRKRYSRELSKHGDTDMEEAFERILTGKRSATGSLVDYF